jgi:cell division protein FtsA
MRIVIGEDDIDRVIKAAEVIALPPEREVIDVVANNISSMLEGIQDRAE